MIIFYIILILGAGVIGFVLWSMINETKTQQLSTEPITPEEIQSTNFKESFSVLSSDFIKDTQLKAKSKSLFPLNNLMKTFSEAIKKIQLPSFLRNKKPSSGFGKPPAVPEVFSAKSTDSQISLNTPQTFNLPSNNQTNLPLNSPSVPTQSPIKSLSQDEVKKIETEIDLTAQVTDLKEKCSRLEKILHEKNAEFDKVQENLNHELKNRKEFNKIKDLLEKEIKDTKDQARDFQSQLNLSKTESEGYKKRISLLEEKSTKLEKDILKKEEEIDTLIKKLQTFASPTTASIPPKKESSALPKEEPVEKRPTKDQEGTLEQSVDPTANLIKATTPPKIEVPNSPNEKSAQQAPIESAEKTQGAGTPQPGLEQHLSQESNAENKPAESQSQHSTKADANDLNLSPPEPSAEQIKNIVEILNSPEENLQSTNQPVQKEDSEDNQNSFLKLNPDIISTHETPSDKPQT